MPSCANPRPKMSLLHRPEMGQLEFKADDEEQQNDTELCHGSDGLRVPDEAQAGWPDDARPRGSRGRRSAEQRRGHGHGGRRKGQNGRRKLTWEAAFAIGYREM